MSLADDDLPAVTLLGGGMPGGDQVGVPVWRLAMKLDPTEQSDALGTYLYTAVGIVLQKR